MNQRVFAIITRLAIVALVGTVLGIGQMRPAFAVQAKPPTDWSFYITTTDTGTAYNLGCNQGQFDASFSPPAKSMVVLDFGGQQADGSGTKLIDGTLVSNAQIEAVAEQFSYGYWVCTGSDTASTLWLGIGTNNSYYDVSSSGGTTWAQVVSAVRSYNQTQGYNSQVNATGASDMEPGWDTAADTEAWVNGYAGVNPAVYINYGSADGCPLSNPTPPYNQSCNNGWKQYDVWYVSWGATPANAQPEIYYSSLATQWTMISMYGAQNQGSSGKILYEGPWDENDLDSSTLTSDQAWTDFWTALNSYTATAEDLHYSAQIHQET